MMANVPRNDALAEAGPDTAEAAAYWPEYVREWTPWNHVRDGRLGRRGLPYVLALA